ncbi:MAG: DsbA family protein [Pseudomonadota bacterium]
MNAYIDFKSPASYLALAPTLSLIVEFSTAVHWHPFRSAERPMPTEVADETVGDRHRRVRARSRRELHSHYAAAQGLKMHWPVEEGSSDLALAALLMIEDDALPFIKVAYAAYWDLNQNLDEPAVIEALLAQSGVSAPPIEETSYRQALETAQQYAEDAGVVDAPAFVLADQLFVGREHMPWIRELLAS